MKTRYAHMQERARGTVQTVVRTGIVSTTAFGFGVLNGKTGGGVELPGGFPLEVLIGGGTWLAGLFGVAGDQSHYLTAIGDGALASLATTFGMGVGQSWDEKVKKAKAMADGKDKTSDPKALATAKGIAMSPEELDRALHG